MSTYINAWIIDPFTRRIARHSLEADSLQDIYAALSSPAGYAVDCITCAGEFENGDAVLIDDNGKLYGDLERQRFFLLRHDTGAYSLIAGRALIVGTGDVGESIDSRSDLYGVSDYVVFLPERDAEKARQFALDEVARGPVIIALE